MLTETFSTCVHSCGGPQLCTQPQLTASFTSSGTPATVLRGRCQQGGQRSQRSPFPDLESRLKAHPGASCALRLPHACLCRASRQPVCQYCLTTEGEVSKGRESKKADDSFQALPLCKPLPLSGPQFLICRMRKVVLASSHPTG